MILALEKDSAEIHDLCYALKICFEQGWPSTIFDKIIALGKKKFQFNIRVVYEKKGDIAAVSRVVLNDLNSDVYHNLCATRNKIHKNYSKFWIIRQGYYSNEYYHGTDKDCQNVCDHCLRQKTGVQIGVMNIGTWQELKTLVLN